MNEPLGPRTPGVVVVTSSEFNRRFAGLPLTLVTKMMKAMAKEFKSTCPSCKRKREMFIDHFGKTCFLHPSRCDLCAEMRGAEPLASIY
jgi:hypothetical protein